MSHVADAFCRVKLYSEVKFGKPDLKIIDPYVQRYRSPDISTTHHSCSDTSRSLQFETSLPQRNVQPHPLPASTSLSLPMNDR
jgi:hypothetical protein